MTLNLEIESLENIIKDFYNVTHIRSSIYDGNYSKILSYPKEHSPICSVMHSDEKTKVFCAESNHNAFEQCKKEKRVIIYTCHMGLSEVVAPLWDNDIIIGYIVFGQIICSPIPPHLTETIKQKCREYGLNVSNVPGLVSKIDTRSEKEILSIAHLMEACTCYIMYREIMRLNRNGFILKLDEYIDSHLNDKITASALCHEFYMSRTKLYDTLNDTVHMSIGRYVKLKRIDRARLLLSTTDLTIMEIVEQTGFSNYNYFCQVFKKEVGLTANQFRSAATDKTL